VVSGLVDEVENLPLITLLTLYKRVVLIYTDEYATCRFQKQIHGMHVACLCELSSGVRLCVYVCVCAHVCMHTMCCLLYKLIFHNTSKTIEFVKFIYVLPYSKFMI